MTWKDEDIDKLFQEASKEKTFEYKEEYWDEMESMLPKKKRKFPFIWIFSSILMTVSIAALLFVNKDENPQISQTSSSSENKVNEKSNISVTTKTLKDGSEEIISEKEKSSKTMRQNNSSTIIKKVLSTDHSEINPTSIERNFTSKSLIFNSANNTSIDYTNLHVNDNSTDGSGIVKTGIGSQINETKNPIIEQKNSEKIGAITLLSIPSNNYVHTLQISNLKSILPFYKWTMYFDLSTSMGQAPMITSSGSNLYSGFGIGTGVNYSNGLWNLNAGVNATFSTSNNLMVSERQKIHGFGAQTFDNEIKYKQLYQLEFPLFSGIKKKNQTIQFGIVPSLFLGTKIHYESVSNNEIVISNTSYGNYVGTSSFGLKTSIGYLYKITPTVQVGGNIQVQLIKQTTNDFFNGYQRHLPINGQLFIRKSLVIK